MRGTHALLSIPRVLEYHGTTWYVHVVHVYVHVDYIHVYHGMQLTTPHAVPSGTYHGTIGMAYLASGIAIRTYVRTNGTRTYTSVRTYGTRVLIMLCHNLYTCTYVLPVHVYVLVMLCHNLYTCTYVRTYYTCTYYYICYRYVTTF